MYAIFGIYDYNYVFRFKLYFKFVVFKYSHTINMKKLYINSTCKVAVRKIFYDKSILFHPPSIFKLIHLPHFRNLIVIANENDDSLWCTLQILYWHRKTFCNFFWSVQTYIQIFYITTNLVSSFLLLWNTSINRNDKGLIWLVKLKTHICAYKNCFLFEYNREQR